VLSWESRQENSLTKTTQLRSPLNRSPIDCTYLLRDPNIVQENLSVEKPYLETYPITVDPNLAYDLLSTMLEGGVARMQQDERSGAITVLGRKEDHELVVDSLASVSDGKAKNFEVITLEKMDVGEALRVLAMVFRQDTGLLDGAPAQGPVFGEIDNDLLNRIFVSGTSTEVAKARRILQDLDASYIAAKTGPRKNVRLIPMSPEERNRLAPALPDLLGSVGRTNPLLPAKSSGASLQKKPASFLHQASALSFLALGADKVNLVSNMMLFQQDGATETQSDDLGYRPPERKKSVPGAPIEFRFTEFGLTVESDDLDAIDDIEEAIARFLGEKSELQQATFFPLQFRDAPEMQQLLESIGGGEGLVAGVVSNILPGGDLLGGLLDGGGGEADVTSGLEGDVEMGTDVRFNLIAPKAKLSRSCSAELSRSKSIIGMLLSW